MVQLFRVPPARIFRWRQILIGSFTFGSYSFLPSRYAHIENANLACCFFQPLPCFLIHIAVNLEPNIRKPCFVVCDQAACAPHIRVEDFSSRLNIFLCNPSIKIYGLLCRVDRNHRFLHNRVSTVPPHMLSSFFRRFSMIIWILTRLS